VIRDKVKNKVPKLVLIFSLIKTPSTWGGIMDYLKAIYRKVKEIEELSWVVHFLLYPLILKTAPNTKPFFAAYLRRKSIWFVHLLRVKMMAFHAFETLSDISSCASIVTKKTIL
jgi:hypothetical protein